MRNVNMIFPITKGRIYFVVAQTFVSSNFATIVWVWWCAFRIGYVEVCVCVCLFWMKHSLCQRQTQLIRFHQIICCGDASKRRQSAVRIWHTGYIESHSFKYLPAKNITIINHKHRAFFMHQSDTIFIGFGLLGLDQLIAFNLDTIKIFFYIRYGICLIQSRI